MMKKKLIILVGPTASGKSELAVKIAKQIDGEIISADSRQIYRAMNIGSGKVAGKWIKAPGKNKKVFTYKGIPHYLIDEASPRAQYSVALFQKKSQKIIVDILKRGKVPIICGGTAQWVDSVVFGQALPEVKPTAALRNKLAKLTTPEAFKLLQKLDPRRAKTIDANNLRRLLRALEIVITTGKPVPKVVLKPKYHAVWLGINPGKDILEKNILKRMKARFKEGMVEEVAALHNSGVSWKRLESFGLEYKFCALFLQGKLKRKEMEDLLFIAIRQYAKRQMTWWKRNKDINWSTEPTTLFTLAKTSIQ